MIAILTGDIKNSTEHDVTNWLPKLKTALTQYGQEPQQWEIYRGDSFQLETTPEKALEAAVYIKACLKQLRGIDVRIAIGLGDKSHDSAKLTESNGSAFVNSGRCFEELKKQNLALKSDHESFNDHINLLLELALLTMDDWTPAISLTIKNAIENPNKNQKELAAILSKSQGNISEELNRGGFDVLQKMLRFYTDQLQKL